MNPQTPLTSELGPHIARYIALKQALGCQYQREHAILAHLDHFLASQPPGHGQLSAETFSHWCETFAHLTPTVRRNGMRIARNLCLYRQRSEPACFVPDLGGFPRPCKAHRAYVFTEQQIVSLLHATERLKPTSTSPLHGQALRLAIVLLYTSGIRRGELVRLTLSDYDAEERSLRIRETKFHKSRLVPLSSDAVGEMERYLSARRRLPHAADAPLLCSRHGGLRPYSGPGIAQGLRRLFEYADIRTARGQWPRVHDLRHTFAHHALCRWYRDGVDVQAKLPALAAYMGHVSIVSTQHYLASFGPFAVAASERFAAHCEPWLTPDAAEGGSR